MKPVHLRNTPPPLETFDHTTFLSDMASWIRPERYLELGIRSGKNLLEVSAHCGEAYGVDIEQPQIKFPYNVITQVVSTDDFFRSLNPDIKFDMVFIDADHSYEQSMKDFLNVKDRVIEDGFVFMHDTYPYDESMTSMDLCGSCYRTVLWIKQNLFTEWEILTLPFNPGLTMLKKMPQNKQVSWE